MPWVKLDDGYPEHPKVVGLTDAAFRTDVEGWCYCARNLTDGFIPQGAAKRWPNRAIAELIEVGRWESTAGGYLIHDWLDYNPSKAKAVANAMARAKAGAKGAASRWHKQADAPEPEPEPEPKNAEGKGALRAIPNDRPDDDQLYLAERLASAWDQELGIPALQKLNSKHGRGAVTSALRQLHGFPPAEAVRSLYAYVDSIAAEEVA